MTLDDVDVLAVTPALRICASESGRAMDSIQARAMLLTIGLQETRLDHRTQIHGPAHGLWQFELGGVRGVLQHHSAGPVLKRICKRLDYPAAERNIYVAIVNSTLLAACLARLDLWCDPHPLPELNDADGSWALYERVWRPGRPRPSTWPGLHQRVIAHLGGHA